LNKSVPLGFIDEVAISSIFTGEIDGFSTLNGVIFGLLSLTG